jgi:hypothetical protein
MRDVSGIASACFGRSLPAGRFPADLFTSGQSERHFAAGTKTALQTSGRAFGLTLVGDRKEEAMENRGALDAELVQAFVGNAHGDLDKVKALLATEPRLLNAAQDWGGGDWETGLGAAAHVGRPDIATYLLAQGARIDLFAAAMLGKLEIVRAILTDDPEARHHPGPHGIPLMVHAVAGGAEAEAVVSYLESLGD